MKRMRFKEWDRVEVRRGDGGNLQSWFRARIVSTEEWCYKVQCDNILNADGKPLVEDVNAEAVRPEPPLMTQTKKLASGDVVEVYDNHSWKLAKVVSTLPRRLFLVELMMEPLRQKTCYQSLVRPLFFWQDGKWIGTLQVDRVQGLRLPEESQIGFQCQDLDVKNNAKDNSHKQSHAKFGLHKHLKNYKKRKGGNEKQSANEGDLMKTEIVLFKKRATQSLVESSLSFLEESDSSSFPIKHLGEECTCLLPFKDEKNQAEVRQCSMAISSSYLSNSDIKYSDRPVGSSPVLTMEDIAAKVHKLELRAYRKTVRAFFAAGCLTWDQEELLRDLRFSLHISQDEHMYEVKYLCPE